MDGEESLLHDTPKVQLIRYHGIVDWPLLHSLSIGGYYVGLKNTVFWDVLIVVAMNDDICTLYHVALVRTDVLEEHIATANQQLHGNGLTQLWGCHARGSFHRPL
jgi:hypothetical protein